LFQEGKSEKFGEAEKGNINWEKRFGGAQNRGKNNWSGTWETNFTKRKRGWWPNRKTQGLGTLKKRRRIEHVNIIIGIKKGERK